MTKQLRWALALVLAAQTVWQTPAALAQIPPHRPGTICATPRFWCWANPPGAPGARCACPTPYGMVAGSLV